MSWIWKKELQQVTESHRVGVEDDAVVAEGRVPHVAARVIDTGRHNAGEPPHQLLHVQKQPPPKLRVQSSQSSLGLLREKLHMLTVPLAFELVAVDEAK